MNSQTIVLKFGGKAVAKPINFSFIAEIVKQAKKRYSRVVTVVSAMGNTTNELIALAHEVHEDPPSRELDMLVSCGERISMSLLAMALSKMSIEAISFTGSQSGIITSENHKCATIIDVRPHRIQKKLDQGYVVIVAGFQGVSQSGEITTLGRGGSDTTAVALAVALDAKLVEFYKDVPGVFSKDPKIDKSALFFEHLSYDDAYSIVNQGAAVLHPRSIQLAKKNQIELCVKSFETYNNPLCTMISSPQGESVAKVYETV